MFEVLFCLITVMAFVGFIRSWVNAYKLKQLTMSVDDMIETLKAEAEAEFNERLDSMYKILTDPEDD